MWSPDIGQTAHFAQGSASAAASRPSIRRIGSIISCRWCARPRAHTLSPDSSEDYQRLCDDQRPNDSHPWRRADDARDHGGGGDSIAFYVHPAGTVEAWFTEWDKQENQKVCPALDVKGDEFVIKDGICHKRRFVDVVGKWEIKNNQLCPSLTWTDGGTEQCWYFVMLLNRMALFDGAGNMLGNEKTLARGKALDKGSL